MLVDLSMASTFQARFNGPDVLFMTPTGGLLISDRLNHAIRQFNPADGLVTTILGGGIPGNNQASGALARFNGPRGIAVDEAGRIYVVDTENHRVAVYQSNASFLREFGVSGTGDGQFSRPAGISIDSTRIYTTEITNNRVQIFLRDELPPVTSCIEDSSAGIAAARAYEKATRIVGRECGKNDSPQCLALLQDQQTAFSRLMGIQDVIQAGCR